MWTPKRLLLLTGGALLFVTCYGLYVSVLGAIDGLPLLPPAYLPAAGPLPAPPVGEQNQIDRRIAQAFGEDCEEVHRHLKIMGKNGVVLATNSADPQPDGRVKLEPFSVAVFKERGDGSYPEINTIRCKEAYLTFDQPIHDPTEIGKHRIIGAELRGSHDGVKAVNNRRTPQKSDDLEVEVTTEPVFFDEKQGRIWTNGFVQLLDTDTKTQPEPTKIQAKGMELFLTKEAPTKQAAHAGHGQQTTAVNGVDHVVLQSNVVMSLWVDAGNGFMAGDAERKSAPSKAEVKKPAEKARVTIRTQGRFTYDLPKDYAVFESSLPDAPREEAFAPGQVSVLRGHDSNGKTYDQLVCDRLELQFRRKAVTDPKAAHEAGSSDREIESAHATARPGENVALAMDSESLHAFGRELFYYSATPLRGAKTILRGAAGAPMWAVKDAHKITAPELQLIGADAKGQGQQGLATGPGQIDLSEVNGTATAHHYHARWKDSLVVTKDREGERIFDLLTFSGEAAFLDDEQHQEMRGDKLQVWLEPPPRDPEAAAPTDKKQPAPDAPRQRPHKVEAFEHVTVHSPELNVRDSEHLIVRFKDGPAPKLPELLPPTDEPAVGAASAEPVKPRAAPATAPAGPATAKKADAEQRPIDLRARRVTALVLRAGSKNELKEVDTEGAVYVHQDGANADDKGVDIQGEHLHLVRHPEGDVLVVLGDARAAAELQLGDLYLSGPTVTINQKDNTAEVKGAGAMQMPSNTALDGGPAKKANSRLVIYWNKDMFFSGANAIADFRGGVQALQDDGKMLCQTLQVTLDRPVSFKEGQKGGQSAKVDVLTCSRQVFVYQLTKDAKGQLGRYDRLEAQEMTADNQQGGMNAHGPGRVFLLQREDQETPKGPARPGTAAPPPAGAAKASELTLTRVDFRGRLFSSLLPAKVRKTTFLDNVEVYHLPADNPDVNINVDRLPKGGLYLKCNSLQIMSRPLPDGKTMQEMWANQNVTFRTPEFYGQAPTANYSQLTELVKFEGKESNLVHLYRFRGQGLEPEHLTGLVIQYNRKTGGFTVDGGREITGTTH